MSSDLSPHFNSCTPPSQMTAIYKTQWNWDISFTKSINQTPPNLVNLSCWHCMALWINSIFFTWPTSSTPLYGVEEELREWSPEWIDFHLATTFWGFQNQLTHGKLAIPIGAKLKRNGRAFLGRPRMSVYEWLVYAPTRNFGVFPDVCTPAWDYILIGPRTSIICGNCNWNAITLSITWYCVLNPHISTG